ncbi:MAG: GntR family transcriptional regulator, partial [Thermoanaerobaculia bacterium]
ATVAKAYQRLTDAGLLAVKRGEGTYVSDSPPAMGRGERAKALKDGATRYASLAVTIGADAQEAASELSTVWKQLRDGAKGGQR